MLLGFAGIQAGIAQATVDTPAHVHALVWPQTDPPGPCDPSELGQSKTGSDGQTYTCQPADSDQGNGQPGDDGSGNDDPNDS
jgi:hypothetical protein